ncbi:tail length tape measure protein [Streptomyces phage Lannister]|uniref:Tape measure protein n=1 Tax=Streptomyces phage Lannister TaxID=1674927 RepID=A0A0K1Y9D3_9CAUD|nr:tail length tape measure protein [Streptomyces phage Lannister]AKY03701.1 tape measure protein [Streptomyces phage Lannister]
MAASPGGQEIGRVSVRVLPDTSRFKRDAEKALERIEKTLEPLKISTKIDMSGASREFLTELRKINQRNRQSDSRKIRFHTTISKDGMTEAVSRAVRQIQEKADQRKIKLTLDGINVKSDVELELNRQSADRVKDEINDWVKDISPIKIQVEPDFSSAGAALTNARLAVLTRPRTVSIVPKLNEAALAGVVTSLAALSGMRVINNLFTKFGNILKNLDKNVPIIGTIATAIAGLGAWGLSAASNLFALSASLAQIGAVGLTLPGILGGFAVGVGVTVAALKDFNKEVPQVKTQLAQLQNQISSNFWEQARQPIRELVDTLLPRFAEGFRATATASGTFFASFATDLTAALNPEIVDRMFGYLNESITKATGGTKTFSSIIAQLGEVGTSYLPNLAGWFVNITKQFDEWLKKKGQLGLRAEIDQGIDALKDLGGILVETGGILAGVARAAEEAGGSSLDMLRQTLANIHTIVDSDGFQNGLVGVFKAAHQAMENLANGAGPAVKQLFIELSELLTTVLPQAGSIIGTAVGAIAGALSQLSVMEGIKAMFTALYQAVTILSPAMAPLGQALGALMQIIATMLPIVANLAKAAIIPLANAFTQLVPMITPVITLLGGALLSAFQTIGPIIQQMVPLVGQMLTAAFGMLSTILPPIAQIFTMILQAVMPLAQTLISALAPILPVLAAALNTVLTALQPIIETALQIITAVIQPLLPMLSGIIQDFLPKLADAFKRLLEAIQPVLDALLGLVNFLMPILVPVLQFIIAILADSLVAAVNGVALVFEGLVEIISGAWDIIVGVVKIAFGLVKAIFTGDGDLLKKGWDQLWNGIKTFAKGLWDTILGLFRTFLSVGILGTATKVLKSIGAGFKAGWQAVKGFGDDAWNAIKGGFSSFMSWLGSLASSGISAVGRFFSQGWTTIRDTATGALSKLITEVGKWIGKAVTAVGELPGKAKSALGNLGSTLMDAGKKLIQGFINGIKNMFGSVKDTLGGLTDKLTSWKGPESLDRVLLVDAGRLVIGGFIKGLESRYGEVRKSLRGLTKDVAGTQFDAPGVGQIRAARGLTAAVSGALDGSLAGGASATKVLNYYAAPGSSLSSEEDLFAAANRSRMVGW